MFLRDPQARGILFSIVEIKRANGRMTWSKPRAGWLLAFMTGVASASFAQSGTTVTSSFAVIRGTVFDSVHRIPLAGAVVLVDGASHIGQTDSDGHYAIDSIPVGDRKVSVSHPLLDTLGIALVTGSIRFGADSVVSLDLAVPSARRIISMFCANPADLARGPAALIGQVNDPDSDKPAVGSKVQLVYDAPTPLGTKTRATVRETLVDSTGAYRICGLPEKLAGKLQVFRNDVSSGQVDVSVGSGQLALRSLGVISARASSTAVDSAGKTTRVVVGAARLTGKVLNRSGQPVDHARVSVAGTGAAALTTGRGDFVLDGLPAGTQIVEVRKLGYGPTDKSVELRSARPSAVSVTMNDFTLPAVHIDAAREQALTDIGYTERKKIGFGYFIDGPQLRNDAEKVSEVVRLAPMLKLVPGPNGNDVIESARDPNKGCVNFIVDGARWKELTRGDINDYLQPSELRAVEVYNPSSVPSRFQTSGEAGCVTVVLWTVRGVNRARKR
jgi:Carboxypeptidase regulatory-like domain